MQDRVQATGRRPRALNGVMVAATLVGLALPARAKAEVIEVYVTEVPYRDPGPAFLLLSGEFLGDVPLESGGVEKKGTQTGFSLVGMSAAERDFQFYAGFTFRQYDLSALDLPPGADADRAEDFEFTFGGRYLSRAPTLLFSRALAVRLSFGAQAAFASFGFPFTLSAGLALSRKDDPSGLLLEIAHRPTTLVATFTDLDAIGAQQSDYKVTIGPWTGLRASFFFGP